MERQLMIRKGFVHTLEAIIATFLVIGFVLFILPALREPANTGQVEKARMAERIKTLDDSGELGNYLGRNGANLSGLLDRISSDAGTTYTYSARWESYSAGAAYGNKSIVIIKGQNNISEAVVSAWNATGAILPETIVWDSGGPKDAAATGGAVNVTSARIDSTHVQVNFTGTGEYRYRTRMLEAYGALSRNNSVWAASYVLPGGILQILYSTK